MQWLEITVKTTPDTIEDTAAALTAGGFADLVIEDQTEMESFLEENRAYWDYIDETLEKKLQGLSCIKLYLEETDEAGLARLRELTDSLSLTFTQKLLPETCWEESWKDNYPPQEIGDTFTVLPYWLAEEDCGSRLPVILNPGLSFGTGAHASTQMVMETMASLARPGFTCLDLGSGSGILSIAALRLGAASSVGVDIDPKAEDAARENAGYNGFAAPEFTAYTGNVLSDRRLMERLSEKQYDLVLVNIVADVIIALSPVLGRFTGESGTLICSGILNTRLQEVTAALEAGGFRILETRTREDWCCVRAQRRIS